MATAFGPQGPNLSTVRPAADPKVSLSDTWFKNCSAAGAKDGTFATADFFNVLVANLRELVKGATVTLDDGDDLMVLKSVQKIVTDHVAAHMPNYSASHGLKLVGSDFQSTLGDGTRTLLTA